MVALRPPSILSQKACQTSETILAQEEEGDIKVQPLGKQRHPLHHHPCLHLRRDADGPSCSDDEKGAKRLRSAPLHLDQSEALTQTIMTGSWELPRGVPTKR